jgi:hypothetical protein
MARYIYTHGLDPYTSVFPYKSMRARVYVSDPFIIKIVKKTSFFFTSFFFSPTKDQAPLFFMVVPNETLGGIYNT